MLQFGLVGSSQLGMSLKLRARSAKRLGENLLAPLALPLRGRARHGHGALPASESSKKPQNPAPDQRPKGSMKMPDCSKITRACPYPAELSDAVPAADQSHHGEEPTSAPYTRLNLFFFAQDSLRRCGET